MDSTLNAIIFKDMFFNIFKPSFLLVYLLDVEAREKFKLSSQEFMQHIIYSREFRRGGDIGRAEKTF